VRHLLIQLLLGFIVCLATPATLAGADERTKEPDLTRQPTLYVVAYAHLDTQWRWEYPRTIAEYLPKTMHDNFALFEKYPNYVFNFSGANRYRMMKEYYPADYETVKRYVAAGRWFPSGSSMEENDVNVPSPESIVRQILYGTQFFKREFGKTSAEFMLPDCFGFPATLPSILAHMGIKGFSTQKLSWGSANGVPFNIGVWEGPDGRGVVVAFNPLSYSGDVTTDLSRNEQWLKRIRDTGSGSGLFVDYHYYGTGDVGGSPREPSVKLMEAIVTKSMTVLPPPRQRGQPPRAAEPGQEIRAGDGPILVLPATAEQMFLDIKQEWTAQLPRYRGDLLLTEHSAGSISSQAYMKRWNRKNELLADAAEKASVAAEWLGGRVYPRERLNNAWTLVVGGQFHDILPGTSTPKAYEFAWNDQILAMNQFAGVMTSATEAIVSGMNTQVRGTPVIVYNPLSIAREDVVEANLTFAGGAPKSVRVYGPDGSETPAQVADSQNGTVRVVFVAKAPSVGYTVYDVRPAETSAESSLTISDSHLENARYRVVVDQNGDVASIFDKKLNKQLLSQPARLALQYEKPRQWPAWNMDWADQQKPPRAYVTGPARVRVVENGPARVAMEISRETAGSKFVQTIRLPSGDAGNRVEFANAIDWKTGEHALKSAFPLTAKNSLATYNWGAGTVQRGNNDAKKYEVPSHQWFDLTDKSGDFGVTVLSDCKYGSDKPDDNTLRLTLIYSPGVNNSYTDQATQDWGHHNFIYGLAAHAGDWRSEQTDWQAYRLNQPLIAFATERHAGRLGRSFSFLRVSDSRVRVLALKKAEQSEEIIVRLAEVDGSLPKEIHLTFPAPILNAREVNGQEQPSGPAVVTKGELVAALGPYEIRSFALRLAEPAFHLAHVRSEPLSLDYERAVASRDNTRTAVGFDSAGRSLPAEMLPREIPYAGVTFHLPPAGENRLNALIARAQPIPLPPGKFNSVYILAAAVNGDQKAAFRAGSQTADLNIQSWDGYIGQWDNRIWKSREIAVPPRAGEAARTRIDPYGEVIGLRPGFVKPAPVAWFASHRHNADGSNDPYAYSYLFAYTLDLPGGATTLTLPVNESIRVLAVTAVSEGPKVRLAQVLED
jgi:alpha-mannosidase